MDTCHHVSPQHLKRYLPESILGIMENDLGMSDEAFTQKSPRGIVVKWLTYKGLPQASIFIWTARVTNHHASENKKF